MHRGLLCFLPDKVHGDSVIVVLDVEGHGQSLQSEQNIVTSIHYNVADVHQRKTKSTWPIIAKNSKN